MLNLKEQNDKLFSVDDYNEDDISSKSKIIKALDKPAFGEFRSKEEIVDKAKATGTGLLTGTLAIPSDLATLSSAITSGVTKFADSPTAMMLKDVLQKAEKDVGREAFDKWFTKTTGIESTPDNVDQLIGEILSPTGAFLAPVKTLKKVFAPLKKGVTDFFDKMPPPDGGLALETAGATKPVGQLEQTKKLLDQEKAITTNIPSSIPADEIVNAPTINPTMAGMNTATGKKQAKLFEELEAKGNTTPEELFQETGVYRGQDGKLRYEIDDRNAEFVKNFKPEVGETYSLSKVLKFDDLYKEYFQNVKVTSPDVSGVSVFGALRNVPIKFIDDANKKFKGEYTASYSPTVDFDLSRKVDDFITINLNPFKDILDPVKKRESIISTLLHEVQHAVQRREGFRTGGTASGELIKSPKYNDYLQAKKTVENSETRRKQYVEDNLEDEIKPNIFNKKQKDDFLTNIDNEIMLLSEYSLKPKERKDLTQAIIQGYDDILSKIPGYKENKANAHLYFAKYLQSKIQKATNKTADQSLKYISNYMELHKSDTVAQDLILREEAIAREKYRRLYGEREANLVQERFERRMKYKEIYGDVTEIDMRLETDFLKGEQSNLGQMGGFKKGQIEIETDNINNVSQSVDILEKTPVKKSPALQKISEITKLRDGTLGNRTPMDKDGLPKNLIRDKDGKPLILYYGDRGYEYKRGVDPKEVTTTPTDIPAKLKNKFRGANFLTYGSGSPTNATYTTPNPVFASSYALGSDRGSVIPIYVIGNKVTDIGNKNFMEIDRAGAKADKGEVIIGNAGQDYNFNKEVNQEIANAADKKYGTQQYVFKDGVQVFSAITGERLTDLPSIKQNIRSKLLNLSQKEEDILLKKMSPEERIKYKAEKTYIPEDEGSYFIEDEFKRDRQIRRELNEQKRNLAKGGDMKKQMDLFQEGGLKDEGGTVDPVSGNDVPPGSTQEEVRDDIPAQLSEGEFVFPADVVRYIGLEKLMTLRQEAKAGLKRMEEMGQMGNSDEATLPDDIPFTIDDLDMEDDLEYNEGGVVKAQTGTFVAPGSGVTTMPSQFAGQQLPSAGATPSYTVPTIPPPVPAPVGGFRPLTTSAQTGQQATGTTPTFQTLIGTKPGQYDEFREYVNEAGMKLQIPFKDGQPIYPIPEGYTFVDPEEVKTEEVTTKEVTPQTTRVTEQDGGDDPDPKSTSAVDLAGDPLSYKSIFNMDKLDTALKDIAFGQLNLFNLKDATMRGVQGQIDINSITLDLQRRNLEAFKTQSDISSKYGTDFNLVTMDDNDRDKLANRFERTGNIIKNALTDPQGGALTVDDLVTKAKDFGMDVKKEDLFSKGTNVLSKSKISDLAKDVVTLDITRKEDKAKARQNVIDTGKGSDQVDADKGFDFSAGIREDVGQVPEEDDDYSSSSNDFSDSYSGDPSPADDDPFMNIAGLLGKKKKPKPKKMKRGGLASRK